MPRSEELRFRAGEVTLAGTLTLPDAAPVDERGRYPNVLLLPSYLARGRDGDWDRIGHAGWFLSGAARLGLLARLANALAELGVATLRYDKRGCGESEGSWEASDLFTLIDDARDALGAIRGRPELDLRRTGIVGHGEGAALAMSVAIGDPAVGALTLVGAAARGLRDVLRRGVSQRAETREDHEHPLVRALDRSFEYLVECADRREREFELRIRHAGVTLNLAAWEQAFHTPPVALATMLDRSVSLVHGERDAWVHSDELLLLQDALSGRGAATGLRLIPAAGHDLARAPDDEIGLVADDLARRLLPRELPPVLLAIEGMGQSD